MGEVEKCAFSIGSGIGLYALFIDMKIIDLDNLEGQ